MKENNNQCLEKLIPKTLWNVARDVHVKAFEDLCCFVDDREVFLVSELNNQYRMLLLEIGGEDYHYSESSTQKLECKLLVHNGPRLIKYIITFYILICLSLNFVTLNKIYLAFRNLKKKILIFSKCSTRLFSRPGVKCCCLDTSFIFLVNGNNNV